jgi:hypothetical protein
MNIGGITYSASIQATETTQYHISTSVFGGHWQWYAYLHDTSNRMEILDRYNSEPCKFWLTSEDAIADAVQYFTGAEDDYPGDTVPTGWDASDHKAMYE